MTKDDIKELAEKAGWMMDEEVDEFNKRLKKFANLVAATERAKCVKKLEANGQYYCRDTLLAGRKS